MDTENTEIDSETAMRIAEYERTAPLERRRPLGKPDREGDIDRGLMRLFSLLGGVAFTLRMTIVRRWNRSAAQA